MFLGGVLWVLSGVLGRIVLQYFPHVAVAVTGPVNLQSVDVSVSLNAVFQFFLVELSLTSRCHEQSKQENQQSG